MIRTVLVLGILLTFACSSKPDSDSAIEIPVDSQDSPTVLKFKSHQGSEEGKLEVLRSHSISTLNSNITRLLVGVQGLSRKSQSIFSRLVEMTQKRNLQGKTLILSPQFKNEQDLPDAGYAFWESGSWSAGGDSQDSSRLSSFEVLDDLISKVVSSGNFPNLSSVVVVGMSAGGQAVQRFAAGSALESQYPALSFRYLVVAPSSYLYLNAMRPLIGEQGFVVPATSCKYNDYRYGLSSKNRYMNLRSDDQIIHDYLLRRVTYLVGSEDDATEIPSTPIQNDPKDSGNLDVNCAARAQGSSRLDRANSYMRYLNELFSNHHHVQYVVSGVAHELKILNSEQALQAAFN